MSLQSYRWTLLGDGVVVGKIEAFGPPEKPRIAALDT
jgi:hypothetical protein